MNIETEKNILKGPEPKISLPADLSMGQFLLDRLPNYEDKVAVIDAETNKEITFAEILDSSRRLAVYLSADGVKKDDRIAVCSENTLYFSIPVCATLYLGATCCPLNPGYSHGEFLHALNISKPVRIFVSESRIENLKKIVKELSWSPKLISLGGSTFRDVPNIHDIIKSTKAPNPETFKACKVNNEDHLVAVLCSSGTTGLPKGVMLTDNNFLTVTANFIELHMEQGAGTMAVNVALTLLPYFHAFSFVTMVNQILLGVTAVLLPRFDPERFLSLIEEYRIENLVVVPPLMVFLAKSPLVDGYDLSSVKMIWCGAAPLSKKISKLVKQRLDSPVIKEGYGLTETTLAVVRDPPVQKPGSIGVLCSGTYGKVISIDENGSGEALGPRQEGELCFKGSRIMKGYYGNPEATRATIDKDGWLHTGDVGYYDEDGYFYIVDRMKELIKYKGFQVPPAELEAALLTHPAIEDAAVIGIPDERCGELPLGFVVKSPGSDVTEAELIEHVNGRVSAEKRLRGGVRFIKSVPKTASGKILRRLLRDSLKSKL